MSKRKRWIIGNVYFVRTFVLVTALIAATIPAANAQFVSAECGNLENAFGPFDYRDPANRTTTAERGESPLSLVERAHFTSKVENLTGGESSSVGPLIDLVYTLRVFPNHHRALNSMANYHVQNGLKKHTEFSVDCWFERAMAFQPDDETVLLVYGVFLARIGRNEAAIENLKAVLSLDENLPEAHYNIGLLYADAKQLDLAYDHARKAYALGYPLPGLRNRLIREGAWKSE